MASSDIYASGEEPRLGDRVTKRGHKPTRPGEVKKVDEYSGCVGVWWGGKSGHIEDYMASDLVLVGPAEGLANDAE